MVSGALRSSGIHSGKNVINISPGFSFFLSRVLRTKIREFGSRSLCFAPHVAPVETDLIITKCSVADFSSSMIECPRLFVFVDIILTDVKRKRLPSAGTSDNGCVHLHQGRRVVAGAYWAPNG